MNRSIQITGLSLLITLSLGSFQVNAQQEAIKQTPASVTTDLDKRFLLPAVKVIQEDAHNRLALLTKQRAFLMRKIEAYPEINSLTDRKKELEEQNARTEKALAWHSWNITREAKNQYRTSLNENNAEIREIEQTMASYTKLKDAQKDLDRTMALVMFNLNHPVEYLVNTLREMNATIFYYWSSPMQERLLAEREQQYKEIAQKIKETPDDEFLQSKLANHHPLAYGARAPLNVYLRSMLGQKAAELEEEVKNKEGRGGWMDFLTGDANKYFDNLMNEPQGADKRVVELRKTLPYFSPKEPVIYDTSSVRGFFSSLWQQIKNAFRPSVTTRTQLYMQQPQSMGQRYQTFLETRVHPKFERYVQPKLEQLERRVQQSPTLRHLPEISMERLESHGFGSQFQ